MTLLGPEIETASGAQPIMVSGRVESLRGMTLVVDQLPLPVGSLVRVGEEHDDGVLGEVVGFDRERALVMTLGQAGGVRSGARVSSVRSAPVGPVGDALLGRVLDGLGRPIDGGPPVRGCSLRSVDPEPIGPMDRARIDRAMLTGVRVLDLMTPVGRGQRLGVFAGPGVGKSTLLAQVARGAEADVSVIALIGERGREVRDFLETSLGEEGLARSVVVVATGDESPVLRMRAARYACSIAEHFRDQGRHAMLVMDSVTRVAHAQRQIGLSVGEPPATKGYTPSVFAALGTLLERAGAVKGGAGGSGGSVTGLYTILVEGDDMTEPVADACRGILDGHVILSRELARRGRFPAVDPLDSISRVAGDVSEPIVVAARAQIIRLLAAYARVEELVQIGAYVAGSDPEADTAMDLLDPIVELLSQGVGETTDPAQARDLMVRLATQAGEMIRLRREQAGVTPAA